MIDLHFAILMGEQPINAQIRAVANLCKYKLVMNFQRVQPLNPHKHL